MKGNGKINVCVCARHPTTVRIFFTSHFHRMAIFMIIENCLDFIKRDNNWTRHTNICVYKSC